MKKQKKQKTWNKDLLPIMGVILLLPFIVKLHIRNTSLGDLSWLPESMNRRADFFLYGKNVVLFVIAVIMILNIIDRILIRNEKAGNVKYLLPLCGYGITVILSTIFSKSKDVALRGMIEQYEGMWILLAYVIVAIYSYIVVQSEKDMECICMTMLTAGILQSVFGIAEILGGEILSTSLFRNIIVGQQYKELAGHMVFGFMGESYQRVSGTLYNSNYAGIYFAMILLLGIFLFVKWDGKKRIYAAVASVLSLICLIGSGSKSAILCMLAVMIWCAAEALFRKQRKQVLYLLAVSVVIGCGYFIYDSVFGVHTIQRITESLDLREKTDKLTDIRVHRDHISIIWDGEPYALCMEKEDKSLYPHVFAKDGSELELVSDEKRQICWPETMEGQDIYLQCYYKDGVPYMAVFHNDIRWLFTDVVDDQYTYINIWGKPDEVISAPSVGFKGKEHWFTDRGYIWSRTIPLLKNKILVGSGPDTFMLQFPQNDYVARAALGYGFFSEIITKPHCMYLQIAVQTGVLSLVFFLCLPIGSGIKYRRNRYRNLKKDGEKQKDHTYVDGIECLIIFYLLTGITNDSMVVLSPLYWVLLGVFMKNVKPALDKARPVS